MGISQQLCTEHITPNAITNVS